MRESPSLEMSLVPDDLTFVQPTDAIGNSRVVINSNDWLLANALSSVSGTNSVTLEGTNTWTGTNIFHHITVTNFTGPFDAITVTNTAAVNPDFGNTGDIDFILTGTTGITANVGSAVTLDTEWDTLAEINTASTDTDAVLDTDIGSTVQAWDAQLDDLADGTLAGDFVNTANPWAVNEGGSGAATFTDGFVLLGSGTAAFTGLDLTTDGAMLVGDGTTDPVAESGATLRTSVGVGTGDSPQFTGIELSDASANTLTATSGTLYVEGVAVGAGGGGGVVQDATSLTMTPSDEGLIAIVGTRGTNSIDFQTVRSFDTKFCEGDKSNIDGGEDNHIRSGQVPGTAATYTEQCTIGGGWLNDIGEGILYSVIGGGRQNLIGTTANSADGCTIGGGNGNQIQGLSSCTIAGGIGNQITGGVAGSGNFIGGGNGNLISMLGPHNVICGGSLNDIDTGDTAQGHSTICGGELNQISADWSAILSGIANDISDPDVDYCWIGGGNSNLINPTTGGNNIILGGLNCSIGGGSSMSYNVAWGNDTDTSGATVSGTVALGYDVKVSHSGVFAFKDSDGADLTSTIRDSFIINFDNGMGINDNAPTQALTVGGNINVSGFLMDGVTAGATADAGSAQGGLPIVTGITEISTVGTTGDSTTLPTAVAGYVVRIINNGANACDVFPASGDNAGAGVDTAVSLAAGNNITYVSYDATNWETF